MASSSVINGLNGEISLAASPVSNLTKWAVEYSSNNMSKTASGTGGYPITLPGVKDWKVAADFVGYQMVNNTPTFITPGTSYAFLGNNGQTGANNGTDCSGTVICEGVTVDCDIEGGGIIGGSAQFGGSGALSFATGVVQTDGDTTPNFQTGISCPVKWTASGGSVVEIPDARGWSLSLGCDVKSYSGSSSSGLTSRIAGGKKSASATVRFYQGLYTQTGLTLAAATGLAPGTPGTLDLYVTPTLFYSIKWAVVKSIAGIGGGAEAAELAGVEIAFDFSSYALVSTTMTIGALVTPGPVTLWP